MKNKSVGFWAAALSAVLALVCLVIMFVYKSQGGIVDTWVIVAMVAGIVCEILLCLGDKVWTDYVGIIGAALLAFVFVKVLADGIWNIAESINGIRMSGIPELAGLNITLAVINLVAIIAAIVACFAKKRKA